MTDTDNNQPTGSKSPSHLAYHVRQGDGDKGYFTHIGAAWPHKDGKGFTIRIETVPLDGLITMRVLSDKKS